MNTYASDNLKTLLTASALGSLNLTARSVPSNRTVRTDRVSASDMNVYEFEFLIGEAVRIVVDGDGDTDLDLFVIDERGNVVASDTDVTDYCVVALSPRRNGPFFVVVENLGRVHNDFELIVERTPGRGSPGGSMAYLNVKPDLLPIEHVDRVFPYDMDIFEIALEEGRSIQVTVSGSGDTDLDLYVVDRFGRLAAQDTGATDLCAAVFQPDHTGSYYVGVDNVGGQFNPYALKIA